VHQPAAPACWRDPELAAQARESRDDLPGRTLLGEVEEVLDTQRLREIDACSGHLGDEAGVGGARRFGRHPDEQPPEAGHAVTAARSGSIRIAVALNSAVPDFGSVVSIVSTVRRGIVLEVGRREREAGRHAGSRRTGTSTCPRHDNDPDTLAVGDSVARGLRA